jgi:hypothetical protein
LHPSTLRPIYCFADNPHTHKLARNHVIDNKLALSPDEDPNLIACREPLDELVKLDMKGLGLVPHKVTPDHLNCTGFERQSVSRATHVLSKSTALALKAAGEKNGLKSDFWKVKFLITQMLYVSYETENRTIE